MRDQERAKEWYKEYIQRNEVQERIKTYKERPDVKQRAREVEKLRRKKPEVQAKLREAAYRWRAKPENAKKVKEYYARPETKAKQAAYHQSYKRELWRQIFDIYGWKCACCGEDNVGFLTIDHINGFGTKERRQGINLKRVRDERDLTKYQILCFNCNCGRSFRGENGVCPHKQLPDSWRFDQSI